MLTGTPTPELLGLLDLEDFFRFRTLDKERLINHLVKKQRNTLLRPLYSRGFHKDKLLRRTIEAWFRDYIEQEEEGSLMFIIHRLKGSGIDYSRFLIETDVDRSLMDLIEGMLRNCDLGNF